MENSENLGQLLETERKKDDTIVGTSLSGITLHNVVDYNDNNVNLDINGEYEVFAAFGLNQTTADSFLATLAGKSDGAIIFTNTPNLLKGVKNHIIINPFTYAPDLPNVFGIKLVVY